MDDYSLVPVEHQPEFESVSLVPVDHDPFEASGFARPTIGVVTPQAQMQLQPAQAQSAQVQTQSALGQQTQSPQQTQTQAAQPVQQTQPQQLAAGANDFFSSIPRGIVSGFNSAASALGRATQAEMGQDVDAPTPEQGMEILEREVTGQMHRPEGRAGRFGASVGEFLGSPASYLAPGGLLFKVGTAALGGLGSEAGGQLGEGTPWEVPLQIAGGALGPGVLSAAKLGAGLRAAEITPTAESQAAGRLAGVTAEAAAEEAAPVIAPDGKYYSVLFEHKLEPTSYPGFWRYKHNREANEAFLQAMEGDDAYAQRMRDFGVNLQRTRTGLAPRTSPRGFTWHHAEEPGVMQLVPREQHDPGSIFQAILHPGGRGGYSIWGKERR